MAPKIQKIKEIKSVYKSILHRENSEYALQFTEAQNKAKQDLANMQLNRWANFKERRLIVMQNYVAALKLKYSASLFVKHCSMMKVLKQAAMLFCDKKIEREISFKSLYIKLYLSLMFKKKLKRNFGEQGL